MPVRSTYASSITSILSIERIIFYRSNTPYKLIYGEQQGELHITDFRRDLL